MDDLREKIIKALECCEPYEYCTKKQCPYYECVGCMESLRDDALSLLKAQEPVEPIEMIDDFYLNGDHLRTTVWKCGKCGEGIAAYDNYCLNCGQAVKWSR